MNLLIEQSIGFLIAALVSTIILCLIYFVLELPLYKRGGICFANYNELKVNYSFKPNLGVTVVSLCLILYNLILACMSAVNNITRINLVVYVFMIVLLSFILLGNLSRQKYDRDLSKFNIRHDEIIKLISLLDIHKNELKQLDDEVAKLKERIAGKVDQIATIVKLDDDYMAGRLTNAKNLVENHYKAIESYEDGVINDFNNNLKKYIKNKIEPNFESGTIATNASVIEYEMSIIEEELCKYMRTETCKQLEITPKLYGRLFDGSELFDNIATATENKYVVLSTYAKSHRINCPILSEKTASQINQLYEEIAKDLSTKMNVSLQLLLLYGRSSVSQMNLLEFSAMIDYYTELKATFDETALEVFTKLMAYLILSVEKDTGIKNRVYKLISCIDKNASKEKLRTELMSQATKQNLLRVVGRVEKQRCCIDSIMAL